MWTISRCGGFGADAGMGRSAFVARTDQGSAEGQHTPSEDGWVKEPRGKSRRHLCISFFLFVSARVHVRVSMYSVWCAATCVRAHGRKRTHACTGR